MSTKSLLAILQNKATMVGSQLLGLKLSEKLGRIVGLALFLCVTHLGSAQAQVGLIMAGANIANGAINKVSEVGKGGYQLPDNSWHPGAMWLEGMEMLVVREEGRKQPLYLAADEVQTLAAGLDTFRVLRNFVDPRKPERQVKACFVKQVYSHAGYLLASCNWENMKSLEWNGDGLWLVHEQQVVAIPVKRKEFEQTMVALFGDHPGLAKQLKAGELRVKHTKQIVAVYANWKQQNH